MRLAAVAMLSAACATGATDIAARRVDFTTGPKRRVVGTYVEVDPRLKPRPPPVHIGHAAVELEDGTLVYLEPPWTKQSIRPPDERRTLAGKRVEATGTVYARCPEPKEPIAHIIGPCVTPVENVTPL